MDKFLNQMSPNCVRLSGRENALNGQVWVHLHHLRINHKVMADQGPFVADFGLQIMLQ